MKQLRPISAALVTLAICTWSASSFACDQTSKSATAASTEVSCSGKSTAATYTAKTAAYSAKQGACTAEMAAKCTPEMAAACAKGAKSAKNVTASMEGCAAHKSAVMTASTEGGSCAAHGMKNSAMAAGSGSCAAHGMKNSAMAAGANGACGPHGAKGATMTAGNGTCGGRGMVWASGQSAHGAACDACADMNACDQSLRELGATMQAVPLKNGVMFVYTTDPAKARRVQRAMANRKDQMALFASASNKSHLCSDCREMRGAAMSGKLTREVVNIEGGCLSLITSTDPSIVTKIHALSGVSTMARAKI